MASMGEDAWKVMPAIEGVCKYGESDGIRRKLDARGASTIRMAIKAAAKRMVASAHKLVEKMQMHKA